MASLIDVTQNPDDYECHAYEEGRSSVFIAQLQTRNAFKHRARRLQDYPDRQTGPLLPQA